MIKRFEPNNQQFFNQPISNLMNEKTKTDHDDIILIEFSPSNLRGTEEVSLDSSSIIERSKKAVDYTLEAIKEMSYRTINSLKTISSVDRPDEVSLEFGLKLTSDAKAFIVNAGSEAHLKVILKWKKNSDQEKE